MRVGRNEPCPCGSGKKYKKCCLENDSARPPADAGAELRESVMSAVLRYAKREEFFDFHSAALAEFEEDHLDHLSDEERRQAHDVDWGVKFSFWFLFDMPRGDEGGPPLGRIYLRDHGHKLPAEERALLERFCLSSLRLYEVAEIQLDSGVRLIDLWSQDHVQVSERLLTRQLQRWDLLAARVVQERERRVFEGGVYLYRPEHKPLLMESLKKERARLRKVAPEVDDHEFFKLSAPFFHQYWLAHVVYPPLPKLVTAEGDPMIFGKVLFDVLDPETLVAALNRHPQLEADEDGWHWWEQAEDFRRGLGSIALDGDRLTLEVTSRQRAERGRRLLEEAAGGAIRHKATRLESVEKKMKKRRPPRREKDGVPPEVEAELLREFKDKHYRGWPDVPLPALDGRTPRRAAKLETLRPRLVDLLKTLENSEARAATPERPAYDFGWLWRELGLERP